MKYSTLSINYKDVIITAVIEGMDNKSLGLLITKYIKEDRNRNETNIFLSTLNEVLKRKHTFRVVRGQKLFIELLNEYKCY